MAPPSTASTPSGTPVIKRSLSDIASDEDALSNVPASCKRFASKVIDIYIGDERYHYAAHTAFLFKSGELKAQYEAAEKAKKKNHKNPTVLNLPRETPKEFGQLLEFLYLGQFTLSVPELHGQGDELLSIWVMGSKHKLVDMQKEVIRKLEELDIAGKLPAMDFLHLADNMYESEDDNGLRRYFAKVAVDVVRKIKTADMPTLLNIMSEGGSFASDLFHAYHQASGVQGSTDQLKGTDTVKYEGQQQRNGNSKRAKADDGSSFLVSAPASLDVRTKWDEEHNIPGAWETASTEDKLLMTKAEDGLSWLTIADLWEKATGTRMNIADLMQRFDRIKANILRLGKRDSDLLQAARTAVEGKFNHEKWPFIAAHMAQNGGAKYEPIRLKRYCDAIDAVARKEKLAENALMLQNTITNGHHNVAGSLLQARLLRNNGALVNYANPYSNGKQNSEPPIEVVGGVRVENSKPLNPRRRRRVAIKAPTASQAKCSSPYTTATRAGQSSKSKRPATRSTSVNIISSDSEESDIVMGNGRCGGEDGSRENSTTVYVDEDEVDFGPVDTGVRVMNEGRKKGPGGMRIDDVDGVVPVAGRANRAIEGAAAGGLRGGQLGSSGTVIEELDGRMEAEEVD